jgi:3-dehydroquinate synthase
MANDSLEKARKEINEIDKEMAELFVRRMHAAEAVAEYKASHNLPILDSEREKQVIERGAKSIQDKELRPYYTRFIKECMALSRDYQEEMTTTSENNVIRLCSDGGSYNITVLRGGIYRAGEFFNLNRRVLIVTDSGVPQEYAESVRSQCREAKIVTVKEGEESKSIEVFGSLLSEMLDFGMTRSDCVMAVGGGVVGDLSGFAASSYMRGVDFYNIPTTLLSQVDSSIGGKTAVNLSGVKNIVGAFYQPRGVIIDTDLLSTLPKRHIANGMAEAIKMSLTSDAEMFEMLEKAEDIYADIDTVIEKALLIKKHVVECDEKEAGLRKILNFGHTIGHGIESARGGYFYHGECVALGMLPMCSDEVRARLVPVLEKAGLPTELKLYEDDLREVMTAVSHDKKSAVGGVEAVLVHEAGSFEIKKLTLDELREKTKKSFC